MQEMEKKKILIGLSDGVDSAVAAYLLKKDGHDVIGLYLDIGGEKERMAAEMSARLLGIKLDVYDIKPELNSVICEPFFQEYRNGRTPSPCIGCNEKVKLPVLIRKADEIGADFIATGHYVRSDGHHLYCGEPDCDQSYMLCRVDRSWLPRMVFPLGGYRKIQVREIAEQNLGFDVGHRPDSRENCFIPTGTYYADWLEERGCRADKGVILFHGERIGEHTGIHRYTVGKRLEQEHNGRRLYVGSIDSKTNTVYAALWEETFSNDVIVDNMKWLEKRKEDCFRAIARLRHTRWEMPECTVCRTEDHIRILSDTPFRAPAPGQVAALYDGQMIIGGGYIRSAVFNSENNKIHE